jgi:3'(2'), 5'-bisphosphate nucleotidase
MFQEQVMPMQQRDEVRLKHMLDAIEAVLNAGQAIMSIYRTDFDVVQKEDLSPMTLADRKANDIIIASLYDARLPMLSEESRQSSYDQRKDWHTFWMVDPLDGTKEFIKKNGEFTVNIALIEEQTPVLGVVFAPAMDLLYFGIVGRGAYKLDQPACRALIAARRRGPSPLRWDDLIDTAERLPIGDNSRTKPADEITIVGSRSHAGPDLRKYLDDIKTRYATVNFFAVGSSLKICLVAEGKADQYPRLGPTMEWDTAAGHAVAASAGIDVQAFDTKQPLQYNKPDLLNPWFIVK